MEEEPPVGFIDAAKRAARVKFLVNLREQLRYEGKLDRDGLIRRGRRRSRSRHRSLSRPRRRASEESRRVCNSVESVVGSECSSRSPALRVDENDLNSRIQKLLARLDEPYAIPAACC